jgi:hypothetical protein
LNFSENSKVVKLHLISLLLNFQAAADATTSSSLLIVWNARPLDVVARQNPVVCVLTVLCLENHEKQKLVDTEPDCVGCRMKATH